MMPLAITAMALAFAAAGHIGIRVSSNGGEHREQKQSAQRNANELSQPRYLQGQGRTRIGYADARCAYCRERQLAKASIAVY